MTNTQASNESTSIYLSKTSTVCEEDDDTEDPDAAELSGSPETSDTIAENESPDNVRYEVVAWGEDLQSSTTNRADLNHSRNISLDVCKFHVIHYIESEKFLEVCFCESTRDKTFVNTCEVLAEIYFTSVASENIPRAAPMIPKETTANHSRQFRTSFGSSPRLSLKMFWGFPPPPAMIAM